MHPWACPRQMQGRRYERSLRSPSGIIVRRNPRVDRSPRRRAHHAIADLLRILSREERTQAAQFSFERDRMRFIQAHGVVRRERPPQGRSKNALRGNCRCEIFRG
jgi:hypothetical protein